MRQDLGYWLLYVLCRDDHVMHLISYPYYTKYARPSVEGRKGDHTAFRHIDLNIARLVKGLRVS